MAEPLRSIPFDYELDDEPLTAHEAHERSTNHASARNTRLAGTITIALGGITVVLAAVMFLASARNLLQVGPGERWTALAGIGLIAVGGLIVVALGLIVRALSALDEARR